jgi:hypothetical protein
MNEITFAVLCELINNSYAVCIDGSLCFPVTYPDSIEFGGSLCVDVDADAITKIIVIDESDTTVPKIRVETEMDYYHIVLLHPFKPN